MNHDLLKNHDRRSRFHSSLDRRSAGQSVMVSRNLDRGARAGLFLQDLFIAIILFSVMVGCLVPMFSFVARSRRLAYQEQLACQIAANCLDDIIAASAADRDALYRLLEKGRHLEELPAQFLQPEAGLSDSFRERLLASLLAGERLPVAKLQLTRSPAQIQWQHDAQAAPFNPGSLEEWEVAIDWQITQGAETAHERHAPLRLSGWIPATSAELKSQPPATQEPATQEPAVQQPAADSQESVEEGVQ